jgi:CRISPR-associated endonuclease Cas1 subtype II
MFRTIVVKSISKLSYTLGYLDIFDGEKEKKVYLKDISLLIIEGTSSVITVPLLIELTKNNVEVIICDEKHNPTCTLLGINNNYHSSYNTTLQINWGDEIKRNVWTKIVELKINMQIQLLEIFNKEKIDIMNSYLNSIDNFDTTNREGLAAKTYFLSLFGSSFSREDQCIVNSLLNYGYAILLSSFNREIVGAGYLTQLGIFHRGKTNSFNFSCDLMEPFRPLVDYVVYLNHINEDSKQEIRQLFTYKVILNDEERYIDDAIYNFTAKIIRILNGEDIIFPTLKFINRIQ